MVTARQLAQARYLSVIVPDGVNAGSHAADAIGSMQWQVNIGGIHCVLSADATGNLVIEGALGSARSTLVTADPFAVTFPGAIFGASNAIVVTGS
jgi:hypothetical protein